MKKESIVVGCRTGRLVVVEVKTTKPRWCVCLCDCGMTVKRPRSVLAMEDGVTRSCGCFIRDRMAALQKTHGESSGGRRTPEYRAWDSIISRHSIRNKGVGVQVCKRWIDGFENFLEDMGRKPSMRHVLRRKDASDGYSVDNCIWKEKADAREMAARARQSVLWNKKRRSEFVSGQRFNLLVGVELIKSKTPFRMALFLCDCGRSIEHRLAPVMAGHKKSCGCLMPDRHGDAAGVKTAEYRAWKAMRGRCYDTKAASWKNYGERGISICERWSKYANFLEDMGRRPTSKHTLDRVDNNGNYEPDNCRWATRKQQCRNKRNNVIVELEGVSRCVSEWAEIYGVNQKDLNAKIRKGMSLVAALSIG